LLDISQIETGALQLHRDRVNLSEFLDQLVDMFRLTAAAKGIAFHENRSARLPRFIHTDEKRLRQIFINLLSNAIKYTQAGSVTFDISLRGQVAEFAVIDTGIGIRAADLTRIFEPFERGHMAAANAQPGTGLGLTITKLLTQILGGEITVESVPGQGSKFLVRLLLSEAPGEPARTPDRRIRAYTGARRKIFIADDDEDHLSLLREILLPLGFILATARDGTSCLAQIPDFAPDLVILDIAMPGISGLDVAETLQARAPAPKILVLSGNFHDAPRGAADGASGAKHYDAFLAKPVDIRALLEQIGTLLSLSWVHDAPALPPPPVKSPEKIPAQNHLEDLLALGRIGYIRGIEAKLEEIAAADPAAKNFTETVRNIVRGFDLARLTHYLETLLDAPDGR